MEIKVKDRYYKNINYKLRTVITFALVIIGIGLAKSTWAGSLMVEEKIVLPESSKVVWALVGGFKAIDRWHPDVTDTTLVGTGKQQGDIRILTLENKETIVERLDFYDENTMTFQYRILESPLPIENYTATLSVIYVDVNMTEVVWKSSFDTANISDDEAKQIIKGIYSTGFQSLIDIFKKIEH